METLSWDSIDPWALTVPKFVDKKKDDVEYEYVSVSDSDDSEYTYTEESSDYDMIKFPWNDFLNNRVSLWSGDITELACDAIVHPCNEKIFEGKTTEFTKYLGSKAGREIRAELKKVVVKTGNVVISEGYELPAKKVIHTASPKFSEQYRTAAENALHNCYRNSMSVLRENELRVIAFKSIHSDGKGYPLELGAHIGIRTVRRFLEHWGEDIDRVIFVAPEPKEYKVYEKILPLYFPRSHAEEKHALEELPRDTGNEFGETVIEERKIRISTGLLVL
eukprot:TRINITY_DN5337_c0_g1_i1.p1 TRINITY_DN5337_c0_g1~~TRINITY_DN5337_c0_g1_i1.p1  ORF type:complete len:277 (-),score=76.60 TRINITY_DN5337_c0_g1_i1:707-1537(-)